MTQKIVGNARHLLLYLKEEMIWGQVPLSLSFCIKNPQAPVTRGRIGQGDVSGGALSHRSQWGSAEGLIDAEDGEFNA